ncbi:MAG: hypothetical protein ACFCVF_10715 [Kineosporiaceae bacterium]
MDRRHVHEIVLREGGEADIRQYIDRATPAKHLGDLVLPEPASTPSSPGRSPGGPTSGW